MNNAKKHLFLVLFITFCASLETFNMEKEEYSGRSGSREDKTIGQADISNESAIPEKTKQRLTEQIKKLNNIGHNLNTHLSDNLSEMSREEYNQRYLEIEHLQNYIQVTSTLAQDMLLGIIPVDMKRIKQRIKTVVSESQQYLQ